MTIAKNMTTNNIIKLELWEVIFDEAERSVEYKTDMNNVTRENSICMYNQILCWPERGSKTKALKDCRNRINRCFRSSAGITLLHTLTVNTVTKAEKLKLKTTRLIKTTSFQSWSRTIKEQTTYYRYIKYNP